MRYKGSFRWVVFAVTTIICGIIGFWIYSWAKNGKLYETGFKALGLRYVFLVVPFVINAILAQAYNVTAGDMNMIALSCGLNFFFPIIGTIGGSGEFFGLSQQWYHILQVAIPLGLTYLMCLQCLLFPEYPVRNTYVAREDNTESVILHLRRMYGNDTDPAPDSDPNKDADAIGRASGRGIK